jgi:hypothetical protein
MTTDNYQEMDKIKQQYKLDLPDKVDQGLLANGVNGVNGVNGANAVPRYLTTTPHFVTVNMTLPLVYLYITKTKGINRSYYITVSSGCAEREDHRFSEELFEREVLLSGYIFDNTYIVEDVIIYKGEIVTGQPIDKRLKLINEIIDHCYVPDPIIETRKIISKDFVEYEYLRSFLTEHIPRLSYFAHVNGLRFCPLGPGRPVMIEVTELGGLGREAPPTLMWGCVSATPQKSTSNSRHIIVDNPAVKSCVFLLKKTDKPDVYELFLKDKSGVLKYYDIACIPNRQDSQRIKSMVQRHDAATRVFCEFNTSFKKWTPISQTNAPVSCFTEICF